MSFPLDLDEHPEEKLTAEINRRAAARANGLCDYCGRMGDMPTCKFPERHAAAINHQIRFNQRIKSLRNSGRLPELGTLDPEDDPYNDNNN